MSWLIGSRLKFVWMFPTGLPRSFGAHQTECVYMFGVLKEYGKSFPLSQEISTCVSEVGENVPLPTYAEAIYLPQSFQSKREE